MTAISETTATDVIELRSLTKRYGPTVAVDDLSLTVRRGEIFGLLGPNGAGKTTTILMMLGLTDPTHGSVRVLGMDPTRDALAVKRRVGYMPDDVGFYDELTGRENLRYTAELNRLGRREGDARIDALLADVGLADAADRPVGGYSRGMRQRLGLADALVKDPEILVLDEPTVNIDPEGVREILALVARLRDERGVTVLLSSHLLNQVQAVCDRVGIFVKGTLKAHGSVDELLHTLHDGWTIEVGSVGGDRAAVAAALLALPGVRAVDGDGSDTHVVRADADVRALVPAAVAGAGAQLVQLQRQRADLDTIYHHYFGGDRDDDLVAAG